MLKAIISPYTLKFAFVARTSRETFTEKPTWFIEVFDSDNPHIRGVGEIAPFPSLQPSFSSFAQFEKTVRNIAEDIETYASGKQLPANSAIRFGVESALADLANGGKGYYAPLEMLERLRDGITINGLVWLDDIDTMLRRVDEKIKQGYRCIKIKIGAANFEHELALLKHIRARFPSAADLELRVDANGAFRDHNVMHVLDLLAPLDIHSIEQPVPRDSPIMPQVCRHSPVPVALDEDMIERWWITAQKEEWLGRLAPRYIVLKPSLAGGLAATRQWIEIARRLDIGWWITSALESNIGLTAIAHTLSHYPEALKRTHGLGTGSIYTNSPSGGIYLDGTKLYLKDFRF